MIELLIAAIVAMQVYPLVVPPAFTGTYQTVAQPDGSLLVTDTRDGSMRRCTVKDNEIKCVPIVLAK